MDMPFTPPIDLLRSNALTAEATRQLRRSRNLQEARETAESFEAMFLYQMLKPIFETVPTDGIMGGGFSEGIYRSLQVEEYGKSMMQAGGIGIADSIMRQIILMQEQEQE